MADVEPEVAAALAPLHGLPLWSVHRAANLVTIQFGERRMASDLKPPREVGTFALHLQCPWRLSTQTGIVTGYTDIFDPADDTVTESELERMQPGRMLGDVEIRRWLSAHTDPPLCVRSVVADRYGGFVLALDDGYALEVFPAAASPSRDDPCEYWRLLQPAIDAPHVVMRSTGLAR